MQWIETRDTAKHPTKHRVCPLNRLLYSKIAIIPSKKTYVKRIIREYCK